MQGESVLRHPRKETIDEMFKNGHTALQVAAWLRQHEKDQGNKTSAVSLQYYRKNFLHMSRTEINQRRDELKSLGKNHDATALTTFAAAKDFIEAKNQQTEKIQGVISKFDTVINEATEAMKLIKEQTVDENGNKVFVPRHYEVFEKMLGRVESASNSLLKATQDMEKQNEKLAASSTTININQVQQESEVITNALKRFLLEVDASKITRFFDIQKEEALKYSELHGLPLANSLKIEVNNNGSDTNISITTNLPTAQQADLDFKDMSNENTTEHIINIEPIEDNKGDSNV